MSVGAGWRQRGASDCCSCCFPLHGQIYPFSSHPFSTPFLCADGEACEGLRCSRAVPPWIPPWIDPEPECSTTLSFSASDKEVWGNGSNPSVAGSIISISPPKKCPFLPGRVCPAPVKGSVVSRVVPSRQEVWQGIICACTCGKCPPAGQDPVPGPGALCFRSVPKWGQVCSSPLYKPRVDQACSILEDEGSSLHLSPDRNHLSR